MVWLDKKISTKEIADNFAGNVENISLASDKYFEFDDDTTGVDIGGEFVTRGQYIPKEFTFDTIIDIEPDELDEYLNIFSYMENHVCRITSPYMGGMFKGEVNISVTNPESSPHVIECTVHIKEIPDVMATLKGDPIIQYPSISTVSDVTVTERETSNKKVVEDNAKPQRYDAPTSSDSRNY